MKHLAYGHQPNRSLVETLVGGIMRMLARRFLPPLEAPGRPSVWRRVGVGILWILALGIQAGLLVLVAELVEVIHGVMELYLDLVGIQLELQSTYIAATTPK